MRREIELVIDNLRASGDPKPEPPPNTRSRSGEALPETDPFERRVREVASLGVAHVKRGDRVTIMATSGSRVVADQTRGIDPLLRFLALLTQVPTTAADHRETPESKREAAA